MKKNIIMRCENSFEGIFTAIYDAFVYKNNMTEKYEDDISISIGSEGNMMLFSQEIAINTDFEKAQKTVYAIQKKLGYSVYYTLLLALCHYNEDRATIVLGYLVRGFKKGTRIQEHMADEYVMKVLEYSRKVSNEADKIRGFLRFSDINNVLISKIEPKCDIIPIIIEHFADRYACENFLIYDNKRNYSVVHPAYCSHYFISGIPVEMNELTTHDNYEQMWKMYFQTMAIKERNNPTCQRNMLPKWYRNTMLEF